MSIPAVVGNKTWLKNWSGNWSFLFASLYGNIYTQGLRDLVNSNIRNFIIVFEKNTSSNYLCPEEIESICKVFIELIKENPAIAERWAERVISQSRKIIEFTATIREDRVSKKEYEEICFLCASMTPENFAIKKVIDYLPQDLLQRYMPLFTEARKATEPIYNEVDRVLKAFMRKEFAGVLREHEQWVLTKAEFEEYLETKSLPSEKLLEDRFEGCGIVYDENGKPAMIEHGEYKELMKLVVKDVNLQEIKGQVAYRGKVTGKVRLVMDLSKAGSFMEGDILVTGMTRPEYLPLMKKAGAFVTDAGGLLSHAAIVAREIKKPCVIGTNVATKVLKDGDMVEVDAERGVVKILEHAK